MAITTSDKETTVSYSGDLQTWTVPTSGWYDIVADGAQGGNGDSSYGGSGAEAAGDLFLTEGETLTIIVGGQGASSIAGGGGGGSFVIAPGNTPLVAAGGGGGGAYVGYGSNGAPGQSGTSGSPGGDGTPGGTSGGGGRGGTSTDTSTDTSLSYASGGGGGLLTAGGDGNAAASGGGGQSALGTAAGGAGADDGGDGGFGGGGGGAYYAGGGGGGYSGGSGAGDDYPGGGGGSFDASIANNADRVLLSGAQSGDGQVTILQVSAPTSFLVASTADLNAAIQAIDLTGSASAPNTGYTITFAADINLAQQLYALNLASGDTLTIEGNGDTLDGSSTFNGFFVYNGTVTIDNLTIQNAKAIGGVGSGGGAGLGGGLFVASGGNVTLDDVSFLNDNATGGDTDAFRENNNLQTGGGGLNGGAGGSNPLGAGGGGGGIGLSASGGTGLPEQGGSSPGAGIVLGAAPGGSSEAGSGGTDGGGGAGGSVQEFPAELAGGGGGGVGGSAGSSFGHFYDLPGISFLYPADIDIARAEEAALAGGAGGFGGGGGTQGGVHTYDNLVILGNGGNGGFGGGGGSAAWSPAGNYLSGHVDLGFGGQGGQGGFGGGGGGWWDPTSIPVSGGFGGGVGMVAGGGGLGAGGAIFVQQGGTLTFAGGNVAGGSVAGGQTDTAPHGSLYYFPGHATNGSAYGSGLFIQGDQQITLSAAAGQSLTVADDIADQTGSYLAAGQTAPAGASPDGTPYAGAGSVNIQGPGTVTLSGNNTFSGGATISSGTLGLQSMTAAGFGAIAFAAGSTATLLVGNGDAPANTIKGFGLGETIDLAGVGLETTATPTDGNVYAFSGGSGSNSNVTLHFDSAQDFSSLLFGFAADGNGGTNVTVTAETAPTIAGLPASQALTDKQTAMPFSGVTLTDPDASQTETITVTLTADGVASDANGTLSGLTQTGVGTYQLTGSSGTGIAALQAALQAVTFTPTPNEVAPGDTVSTGVSVSISDGLKTISATGGLSVTSVNDLPTLAKQVLSYTVAEGQTSQNLYDAILANASDVDPGDQAQITISTVGLSGTNGYAYLDPDRHVLTYTADGYNARQPSDSFSYTVSDTHGGTATGVVTFAITPSADLPTKLGTAGPDTLTASSASTRLIGLGGNDTLNANAASALVFAGSDDDVVNVNAGKATIYGGTGTNTINLGSTAQDSIVLQQEGLDQIFGFNLHNGDQLDLRQMLAESALTASIDSEAADYIGHYFGATPSGNDTALSFNPNGTSAGAGSTLAMLHDVGSNVTLKTLISDQVLRVS